MKNLLLILLVGFFVVGCGSNNSYSSGIDDDSSSQSKNSIYHCSSNYYNCDDFRTHAEAQRTFEACGGTSNDVHRLDRDGDGSACETLP